MLKSATKIRPFDYCAACTFYLGAIVVTLLCQAVAGFTAAALSSSYPDISSNGLFSTAFMIVIQAANVAFIFGYCKLYGFRLDCGMLTRRGDKKLDWRTIVLPVIAGVLIMVAMYLPTVWYGFFTQYALGISPEVGNVDVSSVGAKIMIVIASVFMAPVFEETIYRGVLYNGLRKRFTFIKAVALCALSFMLMHMSPMQVVFQVAIGFLSAAVMEKTDSLLPCVILHATANSLALVMQLTPLADVLNGFLAFLTGNITAAVFITLALAVAGIGALFVLVRYGFGKKSEPLQDENRSETPTEVRDQISAEARGKDGTMRYCIAIGISAILFVINLVTVMVS